MYPSFNEQEFLDKFKQSANHGKFFEDGEFFPGNDRNSANQPYERLKQYETMLSLLEKHFPKEYAIVHKGTPFYFLSWLSFDMGNYEQAVFYMDAAISEDIKAHNNHPSSWWPSPAAKFMFLDKDDTYQEGRRITERAFFKIDEMLQEYNLEFHTSFTVPVLVDGFVKNKLLNKKHRSVVTSLYSFVLEFEDRARQLKLRSSEGGTIEPFLLHLQKGCLIFESILKLIYANYETGTLGGILKGKASDIGCKQDLTKLVQGPFTLQDVISSLLPSLKSSAARHDRAVAITYALRNVVSHSLLWPDIFPGHYHDLYREIMFAVLHVIHKKYCSP